MRDGATFAEKFGFRFGPLDVIRVHSDAKRGVWIEVQTDRERVQIRATRTGRLRVGSIIKDKGGDRG